MTQHKTKILIVGHDAFHNKGCQALIYTTTEILEQSFPDASFTVFSWEPEYDGPLYKTDHPNFDCKFIRHGFTLGEFSVRNRFWFFLNYFLKLKTDRVVRANKSFYDAIKNSNLVVVSGGDILADYGDDTVKHYFFPVAVAIALKKPVFVFAQSISRYRSKELLRFARFYLNRVSLTTVREQVSFEYLKEIGVKAPFHLTADPAFTLKPCSEERLEEILEVEHITFDDVPIIGVSVSKTATMWSESSHDAFLKVMAKVCDKLIGRYKAKIVFVPHVTYPNNQNSDDRLVSKSARSQMEKKKDAFVIEGDYSCAELKAIISKCDLFIGARTHATIASTSMLVPTLAIAYSTKAFGIMEDVLDKEKCVCDINNLNFEELLCKCEYLIEKREKVVKEMKHRIEKIRKRAYLNGELIREILNDGNIK